MRRVLKEWRFAIVRNCDGNDRPHNILNSTRYDRVKRFSSFGKMAQMKVNDPARITALWTAFLLALLFHTQLGLMPLFHGQSVANSHDPGDISWVMWLMLAFFTPPLLAIILPTFTDSKRYRTAHFWLTILYTFLNFAHLIADLLVVPIVWYQIALMAMLVIIGIVLNLVAYHWMTHYHRDRPKENFRRPNVSENPQ